MGYPPGVNRQTCKNITSRRTRAVNIRSIEDMQVYLVGFIWSSTCVSAVSLRLASLGAAHVMSITLLTALFTIPAISLLNAEKEIIYQILVFNVFCINLPFNCLKTFGGFEQKCYPSATTVATTVVSYCQLTFLDFHCSSCARQYMPLQHLSFGTIHFPFRHLSAAYKSIDHSLAYHGWLLWTTKNIYQHQFKMDICHGALCSTGLFSWKRPVRINFVLSETMGITTVIWSCKFYLYTWQINSQVRFLVSSGKKRSNSRLAPPLGNLGSATDIYSMVRLMSLWNWCLRIRVRTGQEVLVMIFWVGDGWDIFQNKNTNCPFWVSIYW